MILKQIAQKISEDTAKIIGVSVSISDENGILIGVNDPSRLGLLDNLLEEVIQTKKLTYWNENDSLKYPNIFPGVASPLVVNDTVVGAVGLVGKTTEDSQTENYIRLVKNHIEMMCYEALKKEINSLGESALNTLIHYVLNYDSNKQDMDQIIRYGDMMGFNLGANRICIIIQINNNNNSHADETSLEQHDTFFSLLYDLFIDHKEDLIGRLTFEQFCILKTVNNSDEEKELFKSLEQKSKELNDILNKRYNLSAIISTGDIQSGVIGLQQSYENALQTLDSVDNFNENNLFLNYNDLSNKLNILIHKQTEDALLPLEQTFKDLLKLENFEVMAETLIAYCDSKFNLSEAARSLFIHRNSLIYRLNQISKYAKIDIENFDHCILLYMMIKKYYMSKH